MTQGNYLFFFNFYKTSFIIFVEHFLTSKKSEKLFFVLTVYILISLSIYSFISTFAIILFISFTDFIFFPYNYLIFFYLIIVL